MAALTGSRQDITGALTKMAVVGEVRSGHIQDGFQISNSQDLPWVRCDI